MELVRQLSIFTVRPGMVLARDILSRNGQILLSYGLPLTDQNIHLLKERGILSVDVVYNKWMIKSQDDYHLFYQETLQAFKHAFEMTRFSKQLPLKVINKLVDTYIGPLVNTHGSIGYLQKIRVHCDYTYRHSIEVSIISGILGKLVGLTNCQLKDLITAGLLHDIGKIFIPLDILNKPSRLTEQEMTIMKTHPAKGYDLLVHSDVLSDEIKNGVLQHHERIDASGYPLGLKEDKIAYYAKIIAIADIYDAITSDRIYRKKLTPFSAGEAIVQQMYTQLDPLLCLTFLRHIKNYLVSSRVLLSNGQKGEVVYQKNFFTCRPIIKLVDGTFLDLQENKKIEIIDIKQ